MSNELTAAEEDAITLTIDTEEPTLNVAPLLREVARIVAAREAAARREALLEAERLGKVVQDAATDLLDISAYLIRASYREDAEKLEQALRSGSARGKALRDRLCAALAEPERDEESGR